MLTRKILLKLLVIFTISLASGRAEATIGRILKVGDGGSVKVIRSGKTLQLRENDLLDLGDEIRTDSKVPVDIRLEDKTLIRVGVSSIYTVQEDSKIKSVWHRLLSGIVRVLVKPGTGDSKGKIKFRMTTPEGTIGVRGTEFVVTRNELETQLKGLDGEVIFGSLNANLDSPSDFVVVKRGFESRIRAGAKGADKPEKFDLKKFLGEVNEKGPLAAAALLPENRRYIRSAPAKSDRAALVLNKEELKRPEVKEEKTESQANPVTEINFQVMLYRAAKGSEMPVKGKSLERSKESIQEDLKLARTALRHGADVNGKDENSEGYTPLQISMLYDHPEMFIFLIQQGADVDVLDKDGRTPLMFAAIHHLDMKFVKALVSPGGANIGGFTDKEPKTALDLAKEAGYEEMAEYLRDPETFEEMKAAQKKRGKK